MRQPQDVQHLTSARASGTKREEGFLRDQDPLRVGIRKAGALHQELEPLRSSLVVECTVPREGDDFSLTAAL